MSSLTVTLIQADLVWEDKSANLGRFEQKLAGLSGKTEIVILPEMFNTGFSMKPERLAETMEGDTLRWMKKMAAEHKIVLTGSLMIEEEGHYFNRLVWMLPSGGYGVYDKRHLFAYGRENEHYAAGNKKLVASVKGWKIQLQVCYDLRFPVWARQPAGELNDKYDLLINVANWPAARRLAWSTLLRARAIENQCFVVGVNRVGEDGDHIVYDGGSTVIGPMGDILYEKDTQEDIHTYTLQMDDVATTRSHYPFWKDADPFLITG